MQVRILHQNWKEGVDVAHQTSVVFGHSEIVSVVRMRPHSFFFSKRFLRHYSKLFRHRQYLILDGVTSDVLDHMNGEICEKMYIFPIKGTTYGESGIAKGHSGC